VSVMPYVKNTSGVPQTYRADAQMLMVTRGGYSRRHRARQSVPLPRPGRPIRPQSRHDLRHASPRLRRPVGYGPGSIHAHGARLPHFDRVAHPSTRGRRVMSD
jgi:hypothetical protein